MRDARIYGSLLGGAALVTLSMVLVNDPVTSPAIASGVWAFAIIMCLWYYRRTHR